MAAIQYFVAPGELVEQLGHMAKTLTAAALALDGLLLAPEDARAWRVQVAACNDSLTDWVAAYGAEIRSILAES
jgi:hypothetical protein